MSEHVGHAAEAIATEQQKQTILLQRLVDHLAPELPDYDKADLKGTGVSFVDAGEQGRIQDFVEKAWKDAGREPTEEEIDRFLNGEEVRL